MKKKYLLNTIRFLILFGFIWIFYSYWNDFSRKDLLFIGLTLLIMFPVYIRTYLLNNYLRKINNKRTIDIWTFFNETPTFQIIILGTVIKPISSITSDYQTEKKRIEINKLTYLTYILIVVSILLYVLL